jgi:hypothetical protein
MQSRKFGNPESVMFLLTRPTLELDKETAPSMAAEDYRPS